VDIAADDDKVRKKLYDLNITVKERKITSVVEENT